MIRSTTKCDLDHIIDVGAGQGFQGRVTDGRLER
jgi:hypothetical protein